LASDHGGFVPSAILLANRFRIVSLVGRGGMGEVYRAHDLELGQPVALKFLPKGMPGDPDALERFRGEVRNARQITHSNFCRVYDIGENEGRTFHSMEYVDGEDLASLLRRIGRLPAARQMR
jgi:serine/threonine-protein kinase